MLFAKLFVFVFGISLIVSCSHNLEKEASGTYKVDFTGFEKEFTAEEILYYSDIYLYLNYDGTFSFSKVIQGETFKKGQWKLHDDDLSNLIVLKYDKNSTAQIGICTSINCITRVPVPYKSYSKSIPFKKIKNEFPPATPEATPETKAYKTLRYNEGSKK